MAKADLTAELQLVIPIDIKSKDRKFNFAFLIPHRHHLSQRVNFWSCAGEYPNETGVRNLEYQVSKI